MVFYYIMPLKALELYLTYIHSKLLYIPEKYRKGVVLTILSLYLLHLGVEVVQFYINVKKINSRKQSRAEKFNSLSQKLKISKTAPNLKIPLMPLEDLSKQILDSTLTPEMVIIAFQQQALNVDKNLNGIVEFLPIDVNELNKKMSAHSEKLEANSRKETLVCTTPQTSGSLFYQIYSKIFSSNQEKERASKNLSVQGRSITFSESQNMKKYSIFGIPISLTEIIHVKSQDATAGLSYNLDVLVKDAVVVKVLSSQGAIPFVRTNVPQIGLHSFASSNPIYGTTNHPFAKGRSPGGSSSGEGSLLACGGSILGIGTDIAGGIRIPAHFCGICGLKTTSSRLSKRGVRILTGQEQSPVCVGPLSRNVDGLVRFMKAVCVPFHFELDPRVTPVLFDDELFEGRRALKIGYFIHDEYTKVTPAVERAVLAAKSMLESCGHKLVKFEPPDMKEMLTELFLPALLGDNSKDLQCYLYTDKVDSSIRNSFYSPLTHYPIRWLASFYHSLRNNPLDAAIMAIKYPSSVSDWWNLMRKIADFRHSFINKWRKANIDIVICPVLPFAALKLGNEKNFTGCLTYTALFNLVDFPAGCVPITVVEQADVVHLKNNFKKNVCTRLEKYILQLDDPAIVFTATFEKFFVEDQSDDQTSTVGLPLGVQVTALPYHDELVLRIMKELEDLRQAGVKNLD